MTLHILVIDSHAFVCLLSAWTKCSQPCGDLPAVGSVEGAGVNCLPETAAMPADWAMGQREKERYNYYISAIDHKLPESFLTVNHLKSDQLIESQGHLHTHKKVKF